MYHKYLYRSLGVYFLHRNLAFKRDGLLFELQHLFIIPVIIWLAKPGITMTSHGRLK